MSRVVVLFTTMLAGLVTAVEAHSVLTHQDASALHAEVPGDTARSHAELPALAPPPAELPRLDRRWSAAVEFGRQSLGVVPPVARNYAVGLTRHFERASVGAQLVRAERFGRRDEALVVDGYAKLWTGAYSNLRVQGAGESEFLPRSDVSIELFQASAQGWEVSGGYRYQAYASLPVEVYGVSVARYHGDWYLRSRAAVATAGAERAAWYAAGVRRLFANTDGYTELSGGFGSEVVDLVPITSSHVDVDLRPARFASLHTRLFPLPHLGITAAASVSDYRELPTRWGYSVGLLARW